jgi:hypothetical protein
MRERWVFASKAPTVSTFSGKAGIFFTVFIQPV